MLSGVSLLLKSILVCQNIEFIFDYKSYKFIQQGDMARPASQFLATNNILFKQFQAIFVNNLIINTRRKLFLKETFVILFVFTMGVLNSVISGTLSQGNASGGETTFSAYNIMVMIFISRSQVLLHQENRQKFIYFLKAYGMSSSIYIFSWLMYSMLIGSLKFCIYLLLVLIFSRIYPDYFQLSTETLILNNFSLTLGNYFLFTYLAFLGTYSYCLLANTLISRNQIGLKLISIMLLVGIIIIYNGFPQVSEISQKRLYQITPSGLLVFLSYEPFFSQYFSYEAAITYINYCLYQISVPIFLACVIQFIKINRFEVLQKMTKIKKKDFEQNNQRQIELNLIDNMEPRRKYLLEMDGLTKQYNGKQVLKNISLKIVKGEVIILYGRNGCGKTTLIKIISNVQYYSKGSLIYYKPLRIGISLQDNYFQDQLTVKENLFFYAKIKGVSIENKEHMMDRFQLTDFCDKEYYKISGGNRKKLSLACAFLGRNDMIILDEPTMGIDSIVKKEIQAIILREKKKNRKVTILISTSESQLHFIEMANRIMILHDKQLVYNQLCSTLQNAANFMVAMLKMDNPKAQQDLLTSISLHRDIKIIKIGDKIRFQFTQQTLDDFLSSILKHNLGNKIQIQTSSISEKIKKLVQPHENKLLAHKNFFLFKQNYDSCQCKQSFWSLLYANFIISYNLIIPTIWDILFFLLVLILSWSFMRWIFQGFQLASTLNTFFLYAYPCYSIFIYSHQSVSYLEYKESHYEITIAQMGMKKFTFWIAYYIINQIVITIPMIFFLLIFPTRSLSYKLFDVFSYNLAFSSCSYFFTIFFKQRLNHINFLPIVLISFYFFSNSILQNTQYNLSQDINTFFQYILPSYSYTIYSYQLNNFQLIYTSYVIFVIYAILFFGLNFIIYRWRNVKRQVQQQSKNVQVLIQNAINEKLKVSGIIEEKSDIFHKTLLVENIYLRYKKKRYGIKGISLAIEQGSKIALTGMNGSGKSTVLKMMLNECFKTFGGVYFKGKQITEETSQIYESISVSPQNNYFIQQMSVYSHLIVICAIKGIPFNRQVHNMKILLDLFDMAGEVDEKIKHLSGGNRRKLKVISALLGKPRFLFLDEPTIGIDQFSQKQLNEVLHYLSSQHKVTSFVISHQLEYIEKLCEKVAIIKKGSLLIFDSISNIKSEFGRGYKIKLFSAMLSQVVAKLVPILDNKFKIYEIQELKECKAAIVLIPWQRMESMKQIVGIFHGLYVSGMIIGYEIKQQQFRDIFDYLVFRNVQKHPAYFNANNQMKKEQV